MSATHPSHTGLLSNHRSLMTEMNVVVALPVLFIAVLVLMSLDQPIAHTVFNNGIKNWIDNPAGNRLGWYVGRAMRQPGEWWVTAVSAALLFIFHKQTWRAGGFMLLAFVPGAINGLLKWVAGRNRPYTGREAWDWDLFRGGLPGLFDQKNLGFASGHATLAFAWAAMMAIAIPRFRVLFYTLAALCGLQRVLSADHYLTDVLVAAVLGVVTVKAMFRILSQMVPAATDVPGNESAARSASQ